MPAMLSAVVVITVCVVGVVVIHSCCAVCVGALRCRGTRVAAHIYTVIWWCILLTCIIAETSLVRMTLRIMSAVICTVIYTRVRLLEMRK